MTENVPATPEREPTVIASSPRGWNIWLRYLLGRGRERLGRAGLVLLLGFFGGFGALLLFNFLAQVVVANQTQALDVAVLEFVRGFASPGLDWFFAGVSQLGGDVLLLLLIGLVIWLLSRGRWGAAAGLTLATAGAHLLNTLLKALYQRPRPGPVETWIEAQHFSFPSGHAMISAAFYLFLAYLAWRILRGWARLGATAGLLSLILLIGVSRLYLGVHYFTDVVAGFLGGFIWVDSVILAGRALRWTRRRKLVLISRRGR